MIWVDLDKTLIFVRDAHEEQTLARLAPFWGMSPDLILHPAQKGRRKLRRILVGGGEARGCVRRGAHEFLRALRQLGEVRMLTTALRGYALTMNAEFKLGFEPNGIFAREDWLATGESRRERRSIDGVDLDAILVDNETDEWSHRQKLGYLGRFARLVTVPDFVGHVTDDFAQQWARHVQLLQKQMEETGAEAFARRKAETEEMFADYDRRKAGFSPLALLRQQEEIERLKKRRKRN